MLTSAVCELLCNDNHSALLIQRGATDWKWARLSDMSEIVHLSNTALVAIWMRNMSLKDKKLIVSYDNGVTFVEETWANFLEKVKHTPWDYQKEIIIPGGLATEISTSWSIAVSAVAKINRRLLQPGLGWEKWTKPATVPSTFLEAALRHCMIADYEVIRLDDQDHSKMIFINDKMLEISLPYSEREVSHLSSLPRPWSIISERRWDGQFLRVMVRDIIK